MPGDWTAIAIHGDTKDKLADMKRMKARGKLENYDDVIRRGMNMPPIAGDDPQ